MSGLIVAGDGYVDRYVNGIRVGEQGPFNMTSFAITPPEKNTITRKSNKRDNYGATLDSVVLSQGSGSISIEIDDADPKALALALLGTVGDDNEIAGTVDAGTPEEITAAHDLSRKLAHRNVSSVVVKSSDDLTTYTNLVDYTINAATGMIKVLSTGSIGDGDTINVSYSYAALTSQKILASQFNEVRSYLRLDGTNLATDKAAEIIVPEAVLIPSGDLSLIGDEFVKWGLTGDIVQRSDETAPYYYREID